MATLEDVLSKYQNHPDFLGVELTRADQRGAVDDMPLHIAARKGDLEDIAILVAHGADVNAWGDLHNTALPSAAMTGQITAVRKLLELGGNPAFPNEFSETPLQVARNGGHEEIVTLLANYQK